MDRLPRDELERVGAEQPDVGPQDVSQDREQNSDGGERRVKRGGHHRRRGRGPDVGLRSHADEEHRRAQRFGSQEHQGPVDRHPYGTREDHDGVLNHAVKVGLGPDRGDQQIQGDGPDARSSRPFEVLERRQGGRDPERRNQDHAPGPGIDEVADLGQDLRDREGGRGCDERKPDDRQEIGVTRDPRVVFLKRLQLFLDVRHGARIRLEPGVDLLFSRGQEDQEAHPKVRDHRVHDDDGPQNAVRGRNRLADGHEIRAAPDPAPGQGRKPLPGLGGQEVLEQREGNDASQEYAERPDQKHPQELGSELEDRLEIQGEREQKKRHREQVRLDPFVQACVIGKHPHRGQRRRNEVREHDRRHEIEEGSETRP